MFIFDLHSDTLSLLLENPEQSIQKNDGLISDYKLFSGGYIAQCFAAFLPPKCKDNPYLHFKKQYNLFKNFSSPLLKTAKTKKEINNNLRNGRVSALLSVENADFLMGDFKKLKIIETLGVKVLGLCWNNENCLGFGNSNNAEINSLPLKKFGCELIERLNHSPIIADVSHLNIGGFKDVCAISKKPFIASHSACSSIFRHKRNLTDEQIKAIANSGGVIGLNFYSRFLNGTDKTEFSDIIRHSKHIINVGGEDAAAIGTDFDGMNCILPLKSAADMPYFADILIKEFGITKAEKICYKNALRLL